MAPGGGKLWRWNYNYNYNYDGKNKAMASYPIVSLAGARKARRQPA